MRSARCCWVSSTDLSIVRGLPRSLLETVKTTAMIFTILIGAILFNNFLILASMPSLVSGWITGLPLGKTAILLVIIGMYFVLGCLLDSLAMILLTIPIVFPIIKALGYDPVWFGIIIVMVVELGLITPPIGMNVFVIKGIARDVPLETIFRGVTPFIVAQIVLIADPDRVSRDRPVAALDDGALSDCRRGSILRRRIVTISQPGLGAGRKK